MISDSAKQGVNQIFSSAAQANLARCGADSVEVQPLPAGQFQELPGQRLVVLTIANFSFKLLAIFHVDADAATQGYFSKPEAGLGFDDVFPEVANLCCGAMNRALGEHFSHLGMSTPYQLDRQCLPFIDVLKSTHLAQHRIVIGSAVVLHATLCLRAYAPLDFSHRASEAVVESGGLELF